MTRSVLHGPPLLAILVASASCASEPDLYEPGCGVRRVELAVGPGTTPAISWSPVCGVHEIEVFRDGPDAGELAWTVAAFYDGPDDRTNALVPPVGYGEVPPGDVFSSVALPLEAGTPYRVVLRVARRTETPATIVAGTIRFTP